jgi:hypothetical protein
MPWKYDPEIGLYFAPPGGGSPATTVTNETTWGITPTVGTATTYAREDHTHGSPTAPSGTGDVTGPSSAVDSNFAAFDTTTGKLIKDSLKNASSFVTPSELTLVKTRLHNVMSTGLKKGGTITINGTLNYRFDLAAGSGVVVNNYTDADNPTETDVSWSAFTSQTLTYLATDDETSIGINSSGAIVQSNTAFSEEDLHDIIQIGTIGHFSRTQIDYIIMEPARITNVMGQLQGFWESFGAFNTDGNEFTANGANMKINKSGGTIFDNETGTAKVPNLLSIGSGTAVYFQYYYQSSPGVWAFGTYGDTVDDLKYDTGSGLGTVPIGKFTIQTIFLYGPLFGTGGSGDYGVDVQYGQVVYDTLTAAQQAITSTVKLNPYLSYDVFRTWLIVKRGTTSLQSATDAMFIQAPPLKFGTMAATGGGSTGETNTVSNVGTAGVGWYNEKIGVDLQFKNAEAASSKISVTDYPTNKTVRLDVVEANIVHNSISGGSATVSVHNFDASGNAPAQTHDNTRHSATYLIASGTATITVGTTAPGSPVAGDLWVDTN